MTWLICLENQLRLQFGLVHVIVQEPDTDDDEDNRPTVFQDGTQGQGHNRGRDQSHRRIFRPGSWVHIMPPPEPGKGSSTPQEEERPDESPGQVVAFSRGREWDHQGRR